MVLTQVQSLFEPTKPKEKALCPAEEFFSGFNLIIAFRKISVRFYSGTRQGGSLVSRNDGKVALLNEASAKGRQSTHNFL